MWTCAEFCLAVCCVGSLNSEKEAFRLRSIQTMSQPPTRSLALVRCRLSKIERHAGYNVLTVMLVGYFATHHKDDLALGLCQPSSPRLRTSSKLGLQLTSALMFKIWTQCSVNNRNSTSPLTVGSTVYSHSTSTRTVWRVFPTFTFLRTSLWTYPGLLTPLRSLRKHTSDYTSWECSRKMEMEIKLLVSFYHSSIESVLGYWISSWCASCSAADSTLQRVINMVQKIIGCHRASMEDISSSCHLCRAKKHSEAIFTPGAPHIWLHALPYLPSIALW